MNGWFPDINGRGEVVSGAGEVFFQGRSLGVGWGPRFLTDDWIVYNADDTHTAILNVRNSETIPVAPKYNVYAAGSGRWMGLWQGSPITLRLVGADGVTIREWIEGATPAMAPNGRYVFASPFHAPHDQRTVFLADGNEEPRPIFAGATMDLSVSDHAVCIMVATSVHGRQVVGIRNGGGVEDWSVLDWEAPIVCDGPGGPWVLSVTQTGMILRPAGSPFGYAWLGEWLNPVIRYIEADALFRIAASDGHGAQRLSSVDPASPRVDLRAPAPPTPNPQPPSPVPVPPKPPEPTPMSLPDPSAVKAALQHERDHFPQPTIGNDAMGEILNAVARQFPNMGMHRKDGQASQPGTGIGISHDVLRYMPPGDDFGWWSDVLGATGAGIASPLAPEWKRSTDGRASFVVPVPFSTDTPPVPGPTNPPPPSAPGAALDAAIAALLARVAALEARPVPQPPVQQAPAPSINGLRIALKSTTRDRYLSDWDNATPAFDRGTAGGGETFVIEVQ